MGLICGWSGKRHPENPETVIGSMIKAPAGFTGHQHSTCVADGSAIGVCVPENAPLFCRTRFAVLSKELPDGLTQSFNTSMRKLAPPMPWLKDSFDMERLFLKNY